MVLVDTKKTDREENKMYSIQAEEEREFQLNARYDYISEKFSAERLDLEVDSLWADFQNECDDIFFAAEKDFSFIESGGWDFGALHAVHPYDKELYAREAGFHEVEVPF